MKFEDQCLVWLQENFNVSNLKYIENNIGKNYIQCIIDDIEVALVMHDYKNKYLRQTQLDQFVTKLRCENRNRHIKGIILVPATCRSELSVTLQIQNYSERDNIYVQYFRMCEANENELKYRIKHFIETNKYIAHNYHQYNYIKNNVELTEINNITFFDKFYYFLKQKLYIESLNYDNAFWELNSQMSFSQTLSCLQINLERSNLFEDFRENYYTKAIIPTKLLYDIFDESVIVIELEYYFDEENFVEDMSFIKEDYELIGKPYYAIQNRQLNQQRNNFQIKKWKEIRPFAKIHNLLN